jgi:hypothetical protein
MDGAPLQIEFQTTLEDYRAALRAHRRSRRTGKYRRGIIGWVLFVALATTLFLILQRNNVAVAPPPVSPSPQPLFSSLILPLIPWLTIFIVIWVSVFVALRRAPRRAWEGQPREHLVKRWQISNECVVIDMGDSKSEMKWSVFLKYVETPTLFLLYSSKFSFYMVPKRAFADAAQLAEFAALLSQHIQPQTQAFPVIAPAERGTKS